MSSTATNLYTDAWGEVIDRPGEGLIEIRWYDSTVDMSTEQFNEWLSTFVGMVEQCARPGVLVDASQFKMDRSQMSIGWRDENIIPRYNRAGVKRFAFQVPAGMPAIGSPPQAEGPADFPTGYFGTRRDALEWLNG